MRAQRWPVWLRVVLVLIVVGAVTAVVVAWLGAGRQQRLADAWSTELDGWADGVTLLPEPPALAAVVDGTGTEAAVAGTEAIDAVNDVCSRLYAQTEDTAERTDPPPPPDGLDTRAVAAADAVERHDAYRTAWRDHVAATAAPDGVVRTFCGSYPSLMVATAMQGQARADLEGLLGCEPTDDGCAAGEVDTEELTAVTTALVGGVRGRADALAASCFLPDLAGWCAAEAVATRELADAEQAWVDAVLADDADAVALARAAQEVGERPLPADVTEDLGEDDAVAATAVEILTEVDTALAQSHEALLDAVG